MIAFAEGSKARRDHPMLSMNLSAFLMALSLVRQEALRERPCGPETSIQLGLSVLNCALCR